MKGNYDARAEKRTILSVIFVYTAGSFQTGKACRRKVQQGTYADPGADGIPRARLQLGAAVGRAQGVS